MTFGKEFQKKLEIALSETAEDEVQELAKLGKQFGNSYAKVAAEMSKLPDNHQTIFIAGMFDGLLGSVCENCSNEASAFTEFMQGLFSLSEEDLTE